MSRTRYTYIRNLLWILALCFAAGEGLPCHAQSGNLPASPLITHVSVDTLTDEVIVYWNPSASDSIEYYTVYTIPASELGKQNPAANPIGQVDAGTYEFRHAPMQYIPDTYVVTATDSSNNESLIGNRFHQPVKISTAYDSCAQQILIEWNGYLGWDNDLAGYRLHGSKHCEQVLDVLVGPEKRSFIHEGVEENTRYNYHLEAFNNQGVVSGSNASDYYTYMPSPPEYINLDYVSVIDNYSVEISFSPDLESSLNTYSVSKASSEDGNYLTWQTLSNVTSQQVILNDEFPAAGQQFFYRVDALNSCGRSVLSSNIAGNILLRGEVSGSRTTISWTPYDGFTGDLLNYDVFRKNSTEELIHVATVDRNTTTFSEQIGQSVSGKLPGRVTYVVFAIEEIRNPYGFVGVSKSNTIDLDIESTVFMPNAFTPNGDMQNDYFAPVFDFIPENFLMIIFDRTGKKLFETRDPLNGWDGTAGTHQQAIEGVYVYHIEYTSYTGLKDVQTGSLTLIRP